MTPPVVLHWCLLQGAGERCARGCCRVLVSDALVSGALVWEHNVSVTHQCRTFLYRLCTAFVPFLQPIASGCIQHLYICLVCTLVITMRIIIYQVIFCKTTLTKLMSHTTTTIKKQPRPPPNKNTLCLMQQPWRDVQTVYLLAFSGVWAACGADAPYLPL